MALIHSNKLVNQVINNLRKGNCHNDFLGKRFVIDSNIHRISFSYNEERFGTTITKVHGKYEITKWWWESYLGLDGYEYEREHTRTQIVSKDSIIVDLIDEEQIDAEVTRVMQRVNGYFTRVKWYIWSEPLNYSEDWGELPEEFESLDNPPSEISIFAEK